MTKGLLLVDYGALLNLCMKVSKPLTLALSLREREQSFEALLPREKGLG